MNAIQNHRLKRLESQRAAERLSSVAVLWQTDFDSEEAFHQAIDDAQATHSHVIGVVFTSETHARDQERYAAEFTD